MRRIICLLCLGSLLTFSQTAGAEGNAWLEEFDAFYEARKLGMAIGEMKMSLEKGSYGYTFEAYSETVGLVSLFRNDRIRERSFWFWKGDLVRPLRYKFTQRGSKRRDIEVEFNWDKNSAVKTINGNAENVALGERAYDRLSYQIAFRQGLRNGKKEFSYPVMEKKGLRIYRFQVMTTESVDTVFGPLKTVKIERVRNKNDNERNTVFWCAEALDYLPVKIRHTEKDGTDFYMYIKNLTGNLRKRL